MVPPKAEVFGCTDPKAPQEAASRPASIIDSIMLAYTATGVSTILSFDPLIDDPSGTVRACQAAFKSYCADHLKLGASCGGPLAKPSPAVYSACVKDDDCFVFSKSSTGGKMGYKMKCHSEKKICTPSYENLREIKFMASGPNSGAPQTCETLSQGSAKKYFEIGDVCRCGGLEPQD